METNKLNEDTGRIKFQALPRLHMPKKVLKQPLSVFAYAKILKRKTQKINEDYEPSKQAGIIYRSLTLEQIFGDLINPFCVTDCFRCLDGNLFVDKDDCEGTSG